MRSFVTLFVMMANAGVQHGSEVLMKVFLEQKLRQAGSSAQPSEHVMQQLVHVMHDHEERITLQELSLLDGLMNVPGMDGALTFETLVSDVRHRMP